MVSIVTAAKGRSPVGALVGRITTTHASHGTPFLRALLVAILDRIGNGQIVTARDIALGGTRSEHPRNGAATPVDSAIVEQARVRCGLCIAVGSSALVKGTSSHTTTSSSRGRSPHGNNALLHLKTWGSAAAHESKHGRKDTAGYQGEIKRTRTTRLHIIRLGDLLFFHLVHRWDVLVAVDVYRSGIHIGIEDEKLWDYIVEYNNNMMMPSEFSSTPTKYSSLPCFMHRAGTNPTGNEISAQRRPHLAHWRSTW
jgi:hypothetical protein